MREPDAEQATTTAKEQLSDAEAGEALALADAAAGADGFGPLSEPVRLGLRYGTGPGAQHLLLRLGADLAGYGFLGAPGQSGQRSGELVVHPAHRRRGFGRALAGAAVAEASPLPVRIWAHGDLPAAAGLAAATGFTRVRSLLLMGRSLREALPDPRPPPGVSVRTFVPGQDEDEWVALNAAAFADHPEQGTWTRRELEQREAQPWFDPDGFFLAVRGGHLVGFHWTKVHEPGTDQATADGQRTGEVYVIGVAPTEQGSGLGRALTLIGLGYLRGRGIPGVMLYVDGENAAAVRLYGSLGFAHIASDVMYEHPAPQSRQ